MLALSSTSFWKQAFYEESPNDGMTGFKKTHVDVGKHAKGLNQGKTAYKKGVRC